MLNRKTPLKRTPFRKALAGTSAVKRRNRIAKRRPRYPTPELLKLKGEWEDKQGYKCMGCREVKQLQNHHIASRAQAPRRFEHPCNYVMLCQECHEPLHATNKKNLVWALSRKLLWDREHFDFEAWQGIMKRGNKVLLLDVVVAAYLEGR